MVELLTISAQEYAEAKDLELSKYGLVGLSAEEEFLEDAENRLEEIARAKHCEVVVERRDYPIRFEGAPYGNYLITGTGLVHKKTYAMGR